VIESGYRKPLLEFPPDTLEMSTIIPRQAAKIPKTTYLEGNAVTIMIKFIVIKNKPTEMLASMNGRLPARCDRDSALSRLIHKT
jgi:hypothetical protein